ncbi:hypothetical protein SAMD00019534_111110 [Acytostelium subglobosum LB1]|uniref:hypothetical protein n=1 Tax=Acytostelium subglobosum LB1 TaxID=1410327 RepID=UPI0006451D7F|nr:hypothetical protein SAMD00019534_111110 [Acytostelium subglobosum LB1]GAM27935.1 hypothetical protein SAMD00019534_111110 [Acytostelium subglobosum LB1]|eukprot:XP_012749218.1 hypothetical protein SAMD00019534_111110 [Acytostelium subglobosum LB1]
MLCCVPMADNCHCAILTCSLPLSFSLSSIPTENLTSMGGQSINTRSMETVAGVTGTSGAESNNDLACCWRRRANINIFVLRRRCCGGCGGFGGFGDGDGDIF